MANDLLPAIDALRQAGIPLMSAPPDTYYEMIDERLPNHGKNIAKLQSRGIFLDGTTENGHPRLLLHIFSETQLDPVFFD